LISRVYGCKAQVWVSGVETHTSRARDFITIPQGTFVEDFVNYRLDPENVKKTVVKFNEAGKEKERTEVRNIFPPMKFFTDLAKSEIKSVVGNDARFTIDWQGKFRQDRFEGVEQRLMKNSKRYRTGYFVPDTEFVITFQRFKDAVEFLNADLDNTRFGEATAEWDPLFENLKPVTAEACPKHRVFKYKIQNWTQKNYISQARAQMGICFVNK